MVAVLRGSVRRVEGEPLRVFLLLRNHDLGRQIRACELWADRNRAVIVGRGIDPPGVLTGKWRPGLIEVFKSLEAEESDGVLMEKLSVLDRGIIGQERWISELRRAGGEVFSCDQEELDCLMGLVPDPRRDLIREVQLAEEELRPAVRTMRVALSKMTRYERSVRGRHLKVWPRYGYVDTDEGLEPNPEEQEVIGMMISLREEGLPWRHIANRLNRLGIKPRVSWKWEDETVRNIVSRYVEPELKYLF